MPDGEKAERAKEALGQLLEYLRIERVYCIDDVYAQEWEMADVLAAQGAVEPAALIEAVPEVGSPLPEDGEVRRDLVRRALEGLDDGARRERCERILTLAGELEEVEAKDSGAAGALEEIVGSARLQKVRPKRWSEVESEVKEALKRGRVLLLFDQDLSRDGGTRTGGMGMVKSMLASDDTGNAVCGLLTHTATPEDQHERWEAVAREENVDRDRFVLVSKGWLGTDPVGFVHQLKMVALSPECRRLKERAKAIIKDVTEEACAEVDAVTQFDFDDIVFRQAEREGMWEADMLFRLHGIFHRSALRGRAIEDGELGEQLERMRKLSSIPASGAGIPAPTSWRLQKREMYEEGPYVNRLHLPIDIGDIFLKTDGGRDRAFIVLSQPCDLMVRSSGKREPDLPDIILAEIRRMESWEPRPGMSRLPYFGSTPATEHAVRFRPVHYVCPLILDLCVFNEDGESKITEGAPCPSGVVPAWAKRYERLVDEARSLLRKYDRVAEGASSAFGGADRAREFVMARIPPLGGNSRLFKGEVLADGGTRRLAFNCARIGRLCRPRAVALASEFAAYFSRPAFERDLGEDD